MVMMMRRLVWIGIVVALMVAACQKEQRPAGVMSQEEFSRYLVDIYLAEARVSTSGMFRDSAMKVFVPMEEKLLRDHMLSDSTLKKTYQYYFDHPDQLELIYDAVIDTLALRHQRTQPPITQ